MNLQYKNNLEEKEDQLLEKYEFYEEWKLSEDRELGVELESYDYARRMECYGLDEEDIIEN